MADIFKIVLTGPESSGKSQMAEALASFLGAPWVPEFARFYVGHLGRPYGRSDLKAIGRGQKLWEQWFEAKMRTGLLYSEGGAQDVAGGAGFFEKMGVGANRCLVLDTAWTVLQIWEQHVYGRHDAPAPVEWVWQKGYGEEKNSDLYLLCAPDFAWAPDPLREHPEARDDLFVLYEALLRKQGAKYVVLRGNHETRLQTAKDSLLSTMC